MWPPVQNVWMRRYMVCVIRKTSENNNRNSVQTPSIQQRWDFSIIVWNNHKNRKNNYSYYIAYSVADPDQVFGGGSQIAGRQKGLHLLKYQRLSATFAGCHTKVVTFCRPKSGYFCMRFSRNNHSLKALYIINSENVWNGSQTVGLIFHNRHIFRIFTKCI